MEGDLFLQQGCAAARSPSDRRCGVHAANVLPQHRVDGVMHTYVGALCKRAELHPCRKIVSMPLCFMPHVWAGFIAVCIMEDAQHIVLPGCGIMGA